MRPGITPVSSVLCSKKKTYLAASLTGKNPESLLHTHSDTLHRSGCSPAEWLTYYIALIVGFMCVCASRPSRGADRLAVHSDALWTLEPPPPPPLGHRSNVPGASAEVLRGQAGNSTPAEMTKPHLSCGQIVIVTWGQCEEKAKINEAFPVLYWSILKTICMLLFWLLLETHFDFSY